MIIGGEIEAEWWRNDDNRWWNRGGMMAEMMLIGGEIEAEW
jgi:hypothetical protein